MNMIEVKNLTKKFGESTAVDSLPFHVAEGEVFSLLGPNGAGKTTTIRMLCSILLMANVPEEAAYWTATKDSGSFLYKADPAHSVEPMETRDKLI